MSEATKGQQNRKQIVEKIEDALPKYCPNTLDKLADFIAYEFYLSPYTVRYTYLPMFVTVGRLTSLGNGLYDTVKEIPMDKERKKEFQKLRKEIKEEAKTHG
jgi:hypothetical protein